MKSRKGGKQGGSEKGRKERREGGETALGGLQQTSSSTYNGSNTAEKHFSFTQSPKQPLQARETLSSSSDAGLWALSTLFPSFHHHFQMWFLGWPFSSTSSQQKRKEQGGCCVGEGYGHHFPAPLAVRCGHVTKSQPMKYEQKCQGPVWTHGEGEMNLK